MMNSNQLTGRGSCCLLAFSGSGQQDEKQHKGEEGQVAVHYHLPGEERVEH